MSSRKQECSIKLELPSPVFHLTDLIFKQLHFVVTTSPIAPTKCWTKLHRSFMFPPETTPGIHWPCFDHICHPLAIHWPSTGHPLAIHWLWLSFFISAWSRPMTDFMAENCAMTPTSSPRALRFSSSSWRWSKLRAQTKEVEEYVGLMNPLNSSNDCLLGVSGTLGKGTCFQTFGKRYEQVKWLFAWCLWNLGKGNFFSDLWEKVWTGQMIFLFSVSHVFPWGKG